jgi:hypothetical protein
VDQIRVSCARHEEDANDKIKLNRKQNLIFMVEDFKCYSGQLIFIAATGKRNILFRCHLKRRDISARQKNSGNSFRQEFPMTFVQCRERTNRKIRYFLIPAADCSGQVF